MYKISEFSSITGLSKETLRYYAEIELLEPAFIDPSNKYRYYDDGSYLLALLLGKLREFGLTIQEMKTDMEDESFADLELLLANKKQKILKKIKDLEQKVQEINEFMESGREIEE